LELGAVPHTPDDVNERVSLTPADPPP
jgi:hypothetical protein